MVNILVVCTGNTCRSAMAEEVLDDAVGRSSILDGRVKVTSAGTFACEGAEATREAIEVMEEAGLPIDRHKARQFTEELAEKQDIILAVDSIVYEQMEAIAPDEVEKMHLLIAYADGIDGEQTEDKYSVLDPFDDDIDAYEECLNQLKETSDLLVGRLERDLKEAEE